MFPSLQEQRYTLTLEISKSDRQWMEDQIVTDSLHFLCTDVLTQDALLVTPTMPPLLEEYVRHVLLAMKC